MDARTAGLIERNVERGASAAFGAAGGFAAYAVASGRFPYPAALGMGALALLIASVACNRVLRHVGAEEQQFDLAVFELPELELEACEPQPASDEPLELEDVLAEPAADSRVVRMFAPESMPAQIGRTLHDQHGRPIPDAAQDLYRALADLRRSLR